MSTRRDELRRIKWRPGSGHEPGQAGRKCADALRRDAGVDRPVLARLERHDLCLAGADEAERNRLFGPAERTPRTFRQKCWRSMRRQPYSARSGFQWSESVWRMRFAHNRHCSLAAALGPRRTSQDGLISHELFVLAHTAVGSARSAWRTEG